MATTTEIKLLQFDKKEALNGATLAFSTDGSINGSVKDYVLKFQINDIGSKSEKYSGVCGNKSYFFNELGECSDENILHNIFIVEATIENTRGTTATRGDSDSTVENVDINSLQPREHFAIAALKGIMYHITDPLTLNDASITLIATKAFEIAQGMMSAAADVRAESSGDTPPTDDKKEELEVNPDEITAMSDKILYNIYVQNNNKAIDEKSRFDVLTGAVYNDNGVLEKVDGVNIHIDDDKPLVAKLHEDSKIAEVVKVTEVVNITKVAEVTKITDAVDVNITNEAVDVNVSGVADVNIASSETTLSVAGGVDVNNTVDISGSVYCTNMISEPVYVSVRNSPTVTVDNMPTEPISITGSVSVDNFPDSGGTD